MFEDGPEYRARLSKPFVPPTVTLKEIHDAVPKHLLRKNPRLSIYYCVRDVACCVAIFCYGFSIERILASDFGGFVPLSAAWHVHVARTALWLVYWWFQGLSFASFFCIGKSHELGHQTLFDNRYVNDILGYFYHAFIMAPFFAWKASHNAHHKTVASIERDENYVPYERNDYPLPPKERASTADYLEMFDETPILTVARMLVMQGAGWWLYMTTNVMGSKRYPKGTNHLSPYSAIFRPDQRLGIFLSDIGLLGMVWILYRLANIYGAKAVLMYYFIPYVLCNHCIIMLTFLHHSDPTIPHYRKDEWSWVRGAAATVDRPLLGWAGRFFLHNVSHDHVAHHFFSYAPFYNQPEITKCVRKVLKDQYNFDSTNTFYALYRSFTQCVYVDDDESIVFYKNKYGQSVRDVAKNELEQIDEHWNPEEQDCGTKVVE
ncbi:fatty acid desaturase-domain-containing protein [Fomitopsis serialis]|uniref:fatty acid desaturase-domain-containing protein n=1 Tax=Fomitopsis serialis TaxID=139415 RepID=UPI0020077BF7|nr:fatty acid desaturase-domain-containing protein [Neoantrodia serialis]KAH9924159.1 fatty acid desaturase-domain-containing protein [Neoantrodia serialis]